MPTGIIWYSKNLAAPLKIPSGYVEKLIMLFIILEPNTSALTNQKDRLPIINANAVIIDAHVIVNR